MHCPKSRAVHLEQLARKRVSSRQAEICCNWLPYQRPYSFASQPFGCFAKYEIAACCPYGVSIKNILIVKETSLIFKYKNVEIIQVFVIFSARAFHIEQKQPNPIKENFSGFVLKNGIARFPPPFLSFSSLRVTIIPESKWAAAPGSSP